MRGRELTSGWRGAALVAVTYVYFLIFAQFGFLARLAELGVSGLALNEVMAAMAVGGILFSLFVPRLITRCTAQLLLRTGFVICAATAAFTFLRLPFAGMILAALLIGVGLGITTVTLVTHLPRWTAQRHPIFLIGIGTGLGYFVCNIPAVFDASPKGQAFLAVLVSVAGIALARTDSNEVVPLPTVARASLSFPLALLSFSALVWLDSAAFFIIQHTPFLKAGTWMGTLHLWTNGCIHLGACILASLLLSSRRFVPVLACSVGLLGFACTLLLHPTLVLPASILYPVGVSFYSVALVAYPSFLSGAQTLQERATRAGWIYAIAGWIGSVLGIGMGQNLGYVPTAFVATAGIVVMIPMLLVLIRTRIREVAVVGAALALAAVIHHALAPEVPGASALSAIERGRQVYISEGCISCHSQYVRPNTEDEMMWGPVQTMQQVHEQKPPLIGNRRQGPDLAEIGLRRSPFWLKKHLIDPAVLSDRSAMPSYAVLFSDRRGDDLVTYLASLRESDVPLQAKQAEWRPSDLAWREASAGAGGALYAQHCATCHEENGAARELWGAEFRKLPPDLAAMRSAAQTNSVARVEQIIRFGIPDTDMPGHEYFSDRQIVSLTAWLTRTPAQPLPHS